MKVSFIQGREITNLVIKDLKFKCGNIRFQEDFTLCNLNGVDVVIGNTILNFYQIEV